MPVQDQPGIVVCVQSMDDLAPARLRIFLTVAQAGSFTHAARILHLSQPALSRSILDLERSLECRLFDRYSGGVRLTAEGRALQELSLEILSAHAEAATRFRNFLAGTRGTLTIAALPSLAASFLPTPVATFLDKSPEVSVRIRDGLGAWVVDEVISGKADLGLTNIRGPSEYVRSERMMQDDLYAVLGRQHPLATRQRLRWQDLSEHPFVALTPESSIRPLTDWAFREAGAAVHNVFEASQVVTVAGFVAAGLGVSALPSLALPLANFADLSIHSLSDPWVHREIYLISNRHRPLSPAARALRNLLTSAAASQAPPN